jgi:hypothetical protein
LLLRTHSAEAISNLVETIKDHRITKYLLPEEDGADEYRKIRRTIRG